MRHKYAAFVKNLCQNHKNYIVFIYICKVKCIMAL